MIMTVKKSVSKDFIGLDYGKYSFSLVEWICLFLRTTGLLAAVGYLFFNTLWVFVFFIPVFICLFFREKKVKIARRRQKLAEQFKEAIIMLYSFVSTGSSLEEAFCRSADNLQHSFAARDDIVREFDEIKRKLSINITIEMCMEDFARRSGIEDIQNFSQVISIVKRGGGSMTSIIKNSVQTIKTKIESENEIRTIISARSNEFKIMVIVPAAVLLYMRLFSPGFMDVLYGNPGGIIFMTLCLAIYVVSVLWGLKILDIHV